MRHAIAIATAATLALLAAPSLAQDFRSTPGEGRILIEEWTVPWQDTRPRDPYTADGDTIWFVGQRDDYLGRFDVATQEFERIEMPGGAGPHNVVTDADGAPWYAGNRDAHISRYDAEAGTFDRIDMPDGHPRDPHTMIFDDDGDLWFNSQGANTISVLRMADRSVHTLEVPTPDARPYATRIAPDGTVWVVLLGTNKLASVDPETMALTEHVMPREDARPRRLDVTADGRVWYVDFAEGHLGVYDPASDSFREWQSPSGADSRPYAMVTDDNGMAWYVETGPSPNLFIGFDMRQERFVSSTPVPSGGGVVRHMDYYAPDGVVWFGADTNTIGRALVNPPE